MEHGSFTSGAVVEAPTIAPEGPLEEKKALALIHLLLSWLLIADGPVPWNV